MAEVVKDKQVTEVPKDAKGVSIAGMVLGICSVVLVVWLGFVLGILAIIFSLVGLKRGKNGMAIAGLVTGIIGLAISILIVVFFAVGIYIDNNERAEDSAVLSSAYIVQKEAELFHADKGMYPSFDELEKALNDHDRNVTIYEKGKNSDGDIIYVPCDGDGGLIWYWSGSYEDYRTIKVGSTYACRENE